MESFEGGNEPVISNVEVFRERNIGPDSRDKERQDELIQTVQDFIASDEQFKDRVKPAEFSLHGVSSIITTIETPEGKSVLKVPMSEHAVGAEPTFLKQWEEVGVSVPHVMREGMLGSHPFWVMNFIDAQTVNRAYESKIELAKSGALREMGTTLRRMHSVPAEGVGRPIRTEEGLIEAPFPDFKSWLESEGTQQRIEKALKTGLLREEHGSIEMASEILLDYAQNNPKTSFCHYDYSAGNIFNTKPLTVFDPDTMYNHGIIDLGRAVLIAAGEGQVAVDDLIAGYYEGHNEADPRAIHAAVTFAAYSKMSFWSKMGASRATRVSNAQRYLLERKNLLA